MTWMRMRDRNLFSNATGLLVCALLSGVVVAASLFPLVAVLGAVSKSGVQDFDRLPTQLTVQQAPQITYVYASDGKTLLTTFYDENRRDVPLADVSTAMQQAIIASEDMRFYQHHGVDLKGVIRALVNNGNNNANQQGASTLTMQYVRQALEYSATSNQAVVDATADTPARKLREMRYALALEQRLSKSQILERYLNIAPFGEGTFGIYAAAEVYFGVPPSKLTLGQASLLAGLVQAPSIYDPLTPDGRQRALERRNNYVLVNMVRMGKITEKQRSQVINTPLQFTGHKPSNGCTDVVNNSWGFFCDFLYNWWLQQPAFGANTYDRDNRLRSGGYTIVTSLNVRDQAAAMKNILHPPGVPDLTYDDPNAVGMAGVEPGTGRVEIMAVNRHYSLDESKNGPSTDPIKRGLGIRGTYPNTTNALLGGGNVSGYQFGSTFKLFTMIAALEKGFPLATPITVQNPFRSIFIVPKDSPAACPGTTQYCPRNATADEANRSFNMWTGLGQSINTYWVPMEQMIGPQNAVNVAKSLGITFPGNPSLTPDGYCLENDEACLANHAGGPNDPGGWGAFTLGVSQSTPLQVANAYATVAADGKYCQPLPVISIADFNGNSLDAANPRCTQAVPVDIARAAVDAARCPVGAQSAFGECRNFAPTAGPAQGIVGKWPLAGKSGTTDDNKTGAATVMTRQLAISGIKFDPDNQTVSHTYSWAHDQVNSAVWHTMHTAMQGLPALSFAAPPITLAEGTQVRIPDVTCKSVDDATSILRQRGFSVTVSNKPIPSHCPAGTVAATSPSGRTIPNAPILLQISAGGGPSPSPGGGNGGHGGGHGMPGPPPPPPKI